MQDKILYKLINNLLHNSYIHSKLCTNDMYNLMKYCFNPQYPKALKCQIVKLHCSQNRTRALLRYYRFVSNMYREQSY